MPLKTGNPPIPKPIQAGRSAWPWDAVVDPSRYAEEIQWPRITVVTPSYNQGDFIEETIRSVLAQNYPNLQYIIVDGGSTDQTVDVISHYEQWVDHWVSEKDTGQSNAINKGISMADGAIFNWLNSDDVLARDALFHIGRAFLEPSTDVVIGKCRHFNSGDNQTVAMGQTQISENTEKTIWRLSMGQPSTYYRFDFIREMKGLDEHLHFAMDTNLWYHFLVSRGIEKVSELDQVISHFRLHDQSKTTAEESRFIRDVNAIRYSLLKACGCPDPVLEFFSEPINEDFRSEWDLRKIDTQKLIGYFAHYAGTEYYTRFDYDKALACYKIALKAGIENEGTARQYYKVKLIPRFILNFVRKKWQP